MGTARFPWLEGRARLTPAKTAVVEAGTGLRLTYAELHLRVNRLASWMQQQGIGPGDRIALLAPNSASYLELLFAAGKTGAVFVPLNYRFSHAELTYVLADCTPKLLVCYDRFAAAGERLSGLVPLILAQDEYQTVVEQGAQTYRPTEVDAEAAWAIIYTGGTTGQAKGVVLSHRAVLWNSINTVASWGLTEQEVTPVYLPMFHTGGLNALLMPVLYMGGTAVIGDQFDPPTVLQVLESERCTIALFVPTMHHMLIESTEFSDYKSATMHTFLSGGAPCPLHIYEAYRAKGLQFKEGYGLTEAGPNNFYIHPDLAQVKIGSVGLPMLHNEVRLVDGLGQDVAPGETGELLIRGQHVFSGYWNNQQATDEALQDGWLHTGDLGRRDADGYHYIVGRKKEMIITGGENVYPLEIEHILAAHPAVKEVVVIGVPHPKWGEVVTAVIVLQGGTTLTADELKLYGTEHLARYKVPKSYVFLDQLPMTPVGKIDKKQLTALCFATA
ncbi:long-chain fatty acid--CoA ligase [Tumebacillus algifaecis]|uniref:Long-chain fatty acid--CoA ligase n=1 Tax=Tumebacillus algifaecis TaxID=1214604 RepID=A0A223D1Q0_9BACL|nr:long-chain fatty acid--CoA ligase [Tumebacillus algifaecis]ASS75307.1 long-chain fatty acid--CoA ligase [Tumebacillus algifaecis]